MAHVRQAVLTLALSGMMQASAAVENQRFFSDDPIQVMPAPLDVGAPLRRDINQLYDLFRQSSRPEPRPPKPAGAVNTLGDVPDSEWFTNRHGRRRMSRAELQLGPGPSEGPQPPFTIVGSKSDGITPGFRMEDAKGRNYFAKVDPAKWPELATGSDVIVAKFLYAIGYNTPKNEIVVLTLSDLNLSDTASMKLPNGRSRKMTWHDVKDIVDEAPRHPDGSFRIVASLAIEGEYIGPFRYEGTRVDDPNDIVAHENRRDLRGLHVFSAWLNNTDMRGANTLDTIVDQNGTRFIRHYLLDFASALGSTSDRPKDVRNGHEFAIPGPFTALKGIFSLGVWPAPWETLKFPDLEGVGNFGSDEFDPDTWKSNFPNPAFLSRLPDDDFWAAKQVMAFSNDDIRAIVETAKYTDPRTADYIITTLAKRRDKIGRVCFSKVLPLDQFRVDNGNLIFDDLAVKYGFHPPRPYDVQWSRFDNFRRTHDPIAASGSTLLPAEALQSASGDYFSASISTPGEQRKVSIYIRKEEGHYKVVGVERDW
jgi:hypothetical protein